MPGYVVESLFDSTTSPSESVTTMNMAKNLPGTSDNDRWSLDGRVAVVTGAARGIGRNIALRLSEVGAAVAVVDKDLRSYEAFELERSQMTAVSTDAEVRLAGGESRGYEVDLSDENAVGDVFSAIEDDFGAINALVCNAGGGSGGVHDNRASELALEDVRTALERNLYTTINSCTAATPALRRAGGGSIVNMGAVNGLGPTPDGAYSHYGLAKAAVTMYTKFLANDLGPSGIRANVIAPGTVPTGRLTEVWAKANVELASAEVGALGRYPDIREIADAVRFLVSDESSYITGHVLVVDGGMTL